MQTLRSTLQARAVRGCSFGRAVLTRAGGRSTAHGPLVRAGTAMTGYRRHVLLVAAAALATAAASAAAAAEPAAWCILSVEEYAGTLAILSPDGSVHARVAVGERPHEVEVSPDGRTAYVSQFGVADYDSRIGTPGHHVAEIDLNAAREIGRYRLPRDLSGPHGIKLRPPAAKQLFVNAEVGGDAMLVFDTATRKLLRRFALPAGTHNFVFTPDGRTLYSFAGAGGVSKIDAQSGKLLAHRDVGSPVRGLAIARDGKLLAAANGEVVVLDSTDLTIARRLRAPVPGQLVYLEALPDGGIAAPALAAGGVVLFAADGSARFVPTGKTPIYVRRGPDGRLYTANVGDDHLSVIAPGAGAAHPLGKLTGPNGLGFGACPRR